MAGHQADHRFVGIERECVEPQQQGFPGQRRSRRDQCRQPWPGPEASPLSAPPATFYNVDVHLRRLVLPELWIPLLALSARLIPGPRTIDDAFITFRYARNFLSGYGLVFNPGEPVLGTTTPVYAVLLAGLGLISGGAGAPFPLLAWILNALADAVTCWLLIRIASRLAHRRAGVAASLVWAVAPMSVTFSIGGMETSLFIALMAATLYLHSAGRPVGAALTGCLSLLTRPDALLLLGPLALERLRLALAWPPSRGRRVPVSWAEALAFFVPIAAWVGFGTAFYGSPIPHSVLAKAVAYRLPPEAAFVRLLQHYATPFLEHLTLSTRWIPFGLVLYPSLCALGAARLLRRDLAAWPLFVYPWLYFTAFALANPLIFRWYLAPPLPFYFLAIFVGAERVAADLRRPRLVLAFSLAALLLSLRGWTLHPDHGPDRPAPQMAFIQLELLYQQVAEDLQGEIQPGQVLAAGDVGALGYYSGARILDTVGLNSPQAVRYYPLPASAYVINYAMPPALIDDLQPDYLVLLESYGRNGLLRDPAFLAGYQLLRTYPTDLYESTSMLVFRRR